MTEFDERYTSYQTDRAPLRKLVRKIYLRSAQSLLRGPTLDFGCGVGELLGRLPEGSRGWSTTVQRLRIAAAGVLWWITMTVSLITGS